MSEQEKQPAHGVDAALPEEGIRPPQPSEQNRRFHAILNRFSQFTNWCLDGEKSNRGPLFLLQESYIQTAILTSQTLVQQDLLLDIVNGKRQPPITDEEVLEMTTVALEKRLAMMQMEYGIIIAQDGCIKDPTKEEKPFPVPHAQKSSHGHN